MPAHIIKYQFHISAKTAVEVAALTVVCLCVHAGGSKQMHGLMSVSKFICNGAVIFIVSLLCSTIILLLALHLINHSHI